MNRIVEIGSADRNSINDIAAPYVDCAIAACLTAFFAAGWSFFTRVFILWK